MATQSDILKIADFPETEISMEEVIPEVLEEVHAAMPFKRHILPGGAMNMVSSVHWANNVPDVRAKFFSGDGTVCEKFATPIHTDLANAANICLHAEDCPEALLETKLTFLQQFFPDMTAEVLREDRIAALWYIFLPDQYDRLKDYLRTITIVKKKLPEGFDPIQERKSILLVDDLRVLEQEHDVKPLVFLQRVGDVAVIPGNHPHQVLNINTSIKMAYDFITPMTVDRHVENLERLRHGTNREDYIGIVRVAHLALLRAARTLGSATSLQKANLELQSDNANLMDRIRTMEEELSRLKDSSAPEARVHPTRTQTTATATLATKDQPPPPQTPPPRPQTLAVPDTADDFSPSSYKSVGTRKPREARAQKRTQAAAAQPETPKRRKYDRKKSCHICKLELPSKIEYDRHMPLHEQRKETPCRRCNILFQSDAACWTHIEEVHKCRCPDCGLM